MSSTKLDANQVFNALYSADLLFTILSFQNKFLIERKKAPIDFKQYGWCLQCFFGLCFYRCSLLNVLKHPESYPCFQRHQWNAQPLQRQLVAKCQGWTICFLLWMTCSIKWKRTNLWTICQCQSVVMLIQKLVS